MKVKTQDKNNFNREIVLPVVGVTRIDEHGCFEVADEVAEMFLEQTNGAYFNHDQAMMDTQSEEIAPQVEEEDLSKSDDNKEELKPQVEENEELKMMIEALDSKTVKELKELAAPFDEAEWGNLKKAELKEYLLARLV